jgi:acyl phosphate:glycerol-3-phosphate acyltransferase
MIYLLPILGYLFGSISSAVVVSRLMGLDDPREVGSKNPGATNVLRYGGKLAAILTLAGDVLKGVIPVLIARYVTDDPAILATTALTAFLGHLFPVFFGFHGGKGVATALGVWLALNPWIGLLLAATWLATAAITRYSSLSSLAASMLAPLYVASPEGPGNEDRSEIIVVRSARWLLNAAAATFLQCANAVVHGCKALRAPPPSAASHRGRPPWRRCRY